MAWKNGYYYRNRRVGKRVISEYVGAGYPAMLCAQLDEHERAKASTERAAWQAEMAEQDAIDQEIDAIGNQLQALVKATLLVAGYHTHKREWRKQRGNRPRV